MAGSTFGTLFRIHTFGESHGKAIGVILDGCPAGLRIDRAFIAEQLQRRRPGQSSIVTQRKETEEFEILSGVFEGHSTGTPICILIPNQDARSKDYSHIKDKFRPSHADYTYHAKYANRDYRGGGRSSARETAARVAAGAIALLYLKEKGISIKAYVNAVGELALPSPYQSYDLSSIDDNIVRCPDLGFAEKMIDLIKKTKKEGDTIGGQITCVVQGLGPGIGEPVFDKLQADLAKAVMSINACKGFEYGSGFNSSHLKGSEHNDEFFKDEDGSIKTKTNYAGGILGGISNGMDIYLKAAFKPVATIVKSQNSVDESGESVEVKGKGRHDPCVVPRAVPIVEAMVALVIADHMLRSLSANV